MLSTSNIKGMEFKLQSKTASFQKCRYYDTSKAVLLIDELNKHFVRDAVILYCFINVINEHLFKLITMIKPKNKFNIAYRNVNCEIYRQIKRSSACMKFKYNLPLLNYF